MRKLIRQIIKEEYDKIIDINGIFLKKELAKSAQDVYDKWEQNEEDYCDYYGHSGGICQDIANEICNVLDKYNIECTTVSATIGEQHVYVVAKTEYGVYEVDIPPYLYETGGGYCWKKIPGVEFNERYIVINMLSPDPDDFENYLEY